MESKQMALENEMKLVEIFIHNNDFQNKKKKKKKNKRKNAYKFKENKQKKERKENSEIF